MYDHLRIYGMVLLLTFRSVGVRPYEYSDCTFVKCP